MKRFLLVLASLVFVLYVASSTVFAAGRTFYISPSGNDSNSGTSAGSPWRSFSKINKGLKPGDTVYLMPGTFYERLKLESSGSSGSPIVIKPYNNGKVVIDMSKNQSHAAIVAKGNHYKLHGLEVTKCKKICISVEGENISFDGFNIHHNQDQGIQFTGKDGAIRNSTVYMNALSNQARAIGGGWPSGIKVRAGRDTTIENNLVYENYGEGIAARGYGGVIRGNTVYDNYSINIYMGNTNGYLVEKNFSYCTGNKKFDRDGERPNAIAMAEEFYEGAGTILGNITVRNNIGAFCKHGFVYNGSETGKGGLENVKVINNTFWGGKERAILIQDEPFKTRNSIIANNIVGQPEGRLANVKPKTGVKTYNNLWVPPVSVLKNASGPGDVQKNPKFATTPGLKPETYRLAPDSPAINAGADVSGMVDDYYGRARSGKIDIGAIEFNSGPQPDEPRVPAPPDPGPSDCNVGTYDFNKDGKLNSADRVVLLGDYFKSGGSARLQTDINGDSTVDGLDYSLFVKAYEKCN